MIDLTQYSNTEILGLAEAFTKDYGAYRISNKELSFEDGTPPDEEITVKLLEIVKNNAYNLADIMAERERLKYIPNGTGLALTYMYKAEQAEKFIAATDPDPDDYPVIKVEIGITASTAEGVALAILEKKAQLVSLSAMIEGKRLTFKKQIAEASTKAAVDAVAAIISYD